MNQRNDEGITRATFQSMEVTSKLDVLFDLVHTINARAPQCRSEIEVRLKKIEGKQKFTMFINTTASLVGGFIGGWSAAWASFKYSIFN